MGIELLLGDEILGETDIMGELQPGQYEAILPGGPNEELIMGMRPGQYELVMPSMSDADLVDGYVGGATTSASRQPKKFGKFFGAKRRGIPTAAPMSREQMVARHNRNSVLMRRIAYANPSKISPDLKRRKVAQLKLQNRNLEKRMAMMGRPFTQADRRTR